MGKCLFCDRNTKSKYNLCHKHYMMQYQRLKSGSINNLTDLKPITKPKKVTIRIVKYQYNKKQCKTCGNEFTPDYIKIDYCSFNCYLKGMHKKYNNIKFN